jgi:hypothetical protein
MYYCSTRGVPVRPVSHHCVPSLTGSFHIDGAPFTPDGLLYPNVSSRESWYNTVLYNNQNDNYKSVQYDTQRINSRKSLRHAKVYTKAATHVGRHTGTHFAESAGVPTLDIQMMGHWNENVMTDVYLSKLSKAALRGLAGRDPQSRDWFLARDIDPPEELLRQVFPFVDNW